MTTAGRTLDPRRAGLLVVGLFVALATTVMVVWRVTDRNTVTGDEPHYLVMADGIARHARFELTRPYADEFATRRIYPPGLAPTGAIPSPLNAHGVPGPHGLYSIHAPGLPALIAVPWRLFGLVGARLALIAVAALGVALSWSMSGRDSTKTASRAIAVGVVWCAWPLLPAASQIYPDVLLGVACLAVVRWLRMIHEPDRADRSVVMIGIQTAATLAVLPFVHVKTVAVGVWLGAFVVWAVWRRTRRMMDLGMVLIAPIVVGAGYLVFQSWAYGNLTGPYNDRAFAVGRMPLTVGIGLYVDQFHGLFAQHPAMLMAALALVPFVRRERSVGWAVIGAHLLFVGLNATHTNWNGGASLAGRFTVSAAVVIAPVAVFGLTRLIDEMPRLAAGLVAVAVAVLGVHLVRYVVLDRALYNTLLMAPQAYRTNYPALRLVLPMLYRSEWTFRYAPNVIAVALVAALIALGAWHHRLHRPVQVAGGVLVGSAAASLLASVVTGPPATTLPVRSVELVVAAGVIEGDSTVWGTPIRASGEVGIVSYGPWALLGSGSYRFSFDIEVSGDGAASAGAWDVVANGSEVLFSEPLPAAAGHTTMTADVDIPADLAGGLFEVRTFSSGVGGFRLWNVSITQI